MLLLHFAQRGAKKHDGWKKKKFYKKFWDKKVKNNLLLFLQGAKVLYVESDTICAIYFTLALKLQLVESDLQC